MNVKDLLISATPMQHVLTLLVVMCAVVMTVTLEKDHFVLVCENNKLKSLCCLKLMFIHADIDECGDGTNSCDVNAECTNTDGSYTCSCSSRYTGDGMSCIGEYEMTCN